MVAVVADQPVPGLVIDHGDVAAGAARGPAAGPANDLGGVAPAIKEEDDRVALLQAGPDASLELPGDDRGVPGMLDDRHRGPPRLQAGLDEESPPPRLEHGLDRGPGRAEHGHRALGAGPQDRSAAGVVGRAFGLDEGLLLLAVQGYQAQPPGFEEERRAGPGDQGRPPAPQGAPSLLPLPLGHPAVEDDGLPAVIRFEPGR